MGLATYLATEKLHFLSINIVGKLTQHMIKIIIMTMLLAFLPGCAAIGATEIFTTLGSWAADGIVEARTGKGIADRVVSDVSGKDYKLTNVFNEDKPVCKEHLKEESLNNGQKEVKSKPNK